MRMPGSPARRGTARRPTTPHAARVPSEMSVSIVAAPWRRLAQAARWNGQPPHSTTGVASVQREPLPVVELERRHHRQEQHGDAEHGRRHQAHAPRSRRVGGGLLALRALHRQDGVVAHLLHRLQEEFGAMRPRDRSRRWPSRWRSSPSHGRPRCGSAASRCGWRTMHTSSPRWGGPRAGRARS